MLGNIASRLLTPKQKRIIRRFRNTFLSAYVQTFRSYDSGQLLQALTNLGLRRGDVVMVHSAYSPYNGFRGSPDQVIDVCWKIIGPSGTILMPSATYNGSTEQFATSGQVFDVRNSSSAMGILSEIFRLQERTVRSQNPAHPILASGNRAAWFTEGHDACTYSCGEGSPFAKLLEADGKALFFDVQLRYMMFLHHVEHLLKNELPFELYDAKSHQVPMIDDQGRRRDVSVRVFSQEAKKRRRFPAFIEQLKREGKVNECVIGNTRLALVRLRSTVEVARRMAESGHFLHDVSGSSANLQS